MSSYHIPVFLDEAIVLLNIQTGKWYVDCNLGGGGHTSAILEKGGLVLGMDMDQDAIDEVKLSQESSVTSHKLIIVHSNFVKVAEVLKENKIIPSGVLFDLGVSTHQLEVDKRGFSFNKDALLDMRMDQSFGASAKDLVNGLHRGELENLFWKYGEENQAKRIAKGIVEARLKKPIETTSELAEIIVRSYRRAKGDHIHPATRVFQALRIAVNDEINNLNVALPAAFGSLEKGGRIVVISFHSLEDRVVKNYFKELEVKSFAKILTDKPITPTQDELAKNPRSRSAKMRAIEKIV